MWFLDEKGEPDRAALAEAFDRIGLAAGCRVVTLVGTTPAAVALHEMLLARECVMIPLDAKRPEVVERVLDLQPGLVIALEPMLGITAIPVLQVDAWGHVLRIRALRKAAIGPPGTGILLQSSGTSGPPKQILLTPSMLAAHAAACRERLHDGPESRWLCVLVPHHVAGTALVDRALRHGSTLYLESSFDVMRCVKLLATKEITHISLVPTQLRRLLEAWGDRPAPPTLRCVLLGGDAAPADLVASALQHGWPVHTTYGLTEATSQVATARPDEVQARPGTSGRPLPGVEVTIVDGEIIVQGSTVVGGRVATGDIGYLDADGFLFVEGRRDDRITSGGEKIDPARVEAVLRQHPSVADAVVVGLPHTSWGREVVAAVHLQTPVAEAELIAFCKKHLARHEVPKRFRVVHEVPRTANGKLRRAEVRAAWETYGTMPT